MSCCEVFLNWPESSASRLTYVERMLTTKRSTPSTSRMRAAMMRPFEGDLAAEVAVTARGPL